MIRVKLTSRCFLFIQLIAAAILLTSVTQSVFATQANATTGHNHELDALFHDALRAVGDEEAINEIRSIEVFAECNGPTGAYTTEIQSFLTNKTRFQQKFANRAEARTVFINQGIGWRAGDSAGSESLISPFHRLVVNLHEYQRIVIDFQRMFTAFELVGEATFNGKPAVKVNANTEPGVPISLFFDAESKLMTGYVLSTPDGPVTNIFDEWTLVNNVRLPSVVRAIDNSGEFVLRFDRITTNESDESDLDIPPRLADLASLTRLQNQATTAHLDYDAELLVEMFSDEGITEISRGEVTILSNDAGLNRFRTYFESVRFLEWADRAPPVFEISGDGSMASVTVQKRVRSFPKSDEDDRNVQQTDFAWLEVWQKVEGTWKLKLIASTDGQVQSNAK